MAFEPETLKELLEWRNSLPGWKWRPSWDCCEELRRLCARARIVTQGRRVLDGFGLQVGEPQPVPAEAFVDFKLGEDLLTNHGELRGRGAGVRWTDLRFPNDTRHVWQAALDAGEIRAPRASPPLPETTPMPAVPIVAPAQATSQPAETSRGSELVLKARAWLEETYAQPEGTALRDRVNAAIPGPGKYKKLTRGFKEAPGGQKIGERDMRRALTGK